MSSGPFIVVFLVSALALAAWTIARFQHFGPRTLTGAIVASGASWILIGALPGLIDGVLALGLPYGTFVVIFGVALPVFTYWFLAGGWFMRVLASLPDGLR